MRSYASRRVGGKAAGVARLFIAALLAALPAGVLAAGAPPQAGPTFSVKQYRVHYDVHADGTYQELDEIVITVLNEQGVRMAQQMPAGIDRMTLPLSGEEFEVVKAYTLKKNGEQVAATPAKAPPGMEQMKFLAFPRVEIGDTLVASNRATLKQAQFPNNNFVLRQAFPRFTEYDDVLITLTAPASVRVRAVASGIAEGKRTLDGPLQKWEWRYQNKASVPFSPQGTQPPLDTLRISSFADDAAEAQAAGKPAASPTLPAHFVCPLFPGIPSEGPDGVERVEQQVAFLLWNEGGDSLLHAADAWSAPSCVFDDGRPVLSALRDGIKDAFAAEHDWSRGSARVNEFKQAHPRDPFAALAEVAYWNAYAWDARGGGYASSVSDDGWTLFKERMEKAAQVLRTSKPYAAQSPVWYEEMINAHSALGRPEDERDQIFLEGVKRYPAYYPIYFTMLNYLLPKWGGTWRTVDNMVNWSVEHTRAQEGMTLYARLYWVVGGDPEVKLFRDTFASWPKMKQGFEDMMARHPKSKWNLNNFARFACIAGDKDTFLKLRAQMGSEVMPAAWQGKVTLDLCQTKFGYAE